MPAPAAGSTVSLNPHKKHRNTPPPCSCWPTSLWSQPFCSQKKQYIYQFCSLISFGWFLSASAQQQVYLLWGKKYCQSWHLPRDFFMCLSTLGFPREQNPSKSITLGQGDAGGSFMNICILALLDIIPTLIDTCFFFIIIIIFCISFPSCMTSCSE